jgi:hypothetical protein
MLIVLDWVMAVGGKNEVSWDELCSLVEQLEEGVLSVGSWLSEQDWASCVVDVFAVTGDGLAVGLHGELLEIGREAMHILVESRYNVNLRWLVIEN